MSPTKHNYDLRVKTLRQNAANGWKKLSLLELPTLGRHQFSRWAQVSRNPNLKKVSWWSLRLRSKFVGSDRGWDGSKFDKEKFLKLFSLALSCKAHSNPNLQRWTEQKPTRVSYSFGHNKKWFIVAEACFLYRPQRPKPMESSWVAPLITVSYSSCLIESLAKWWIQIKNFGWTFSHDL